MFSRRIIISLSVLWGLFTLALTGWWFIFSLRQLSLIKSIEGNLAEQVARNQMMLVWEGVTLFILILLGVAAIFYVSYREIREARKVKNLFATFSHELKTPLSSLRLQVESLSEEADPVEQKKLLEHINADIERLNLRIENSLMLPGVTEYKTFLEPLSLDDMLSEVELSWPQLTFRRMNTEGVALLADTRALVSILGNIAQNSLIHGRANELNIKVLDGQNNKYVQVQFTDNGRGFQGDIKKLGRSLHRHYAGSGSGIGLYLAHQLMRRMQGNIKFETSASKFAILLTFRREV